MIPRIARTALLLAAALAVALPTSRLRAQDASTDSAATSPSTPVVEPGDEVDISMFTAAGKRLDEVSGKRTVDRKGRLFLPYVGSVSVQGQDAAEIRDDLVRRYADYYTNPVVDVETKIRVNVTGAVRQPGNYFLSPTSTVVDALATAGGTTPEVEISGQNAAADPGHVRLVRRGGKTLILDLRPEAPDTSVFNLLVQSGDWLHVPPRNESRWRSDLQLMSAFFSVVGSVAAIVVLVRH